MSFVAPLAGGAAAGAAASRVRRAVAGRGHRLPRCDRGDEPHGGQRIVERVGKSKLLTEIADADVAALVARRPGRRVIRSPKQKKEAAPLIANGTVNRSTTEVLRKLFTYATVSGVLICRQPNWARHMLPEPPERIRELHDDEAERLGAATRADFEPFFASAADAGTRATGD